MFRHLFKYKILTILREKEIMFWTFAFPLILGTLFFVSFGDIQSSVEEFDSIPIAVITEEENETVSMVLTELSKESDNKILDITTATREEAETMLEEETVDAALIVGKDVSILINENGLNQSIVKSIVDEIKIINSTITNVSSSNPGKLHDAINTLSGKVDYNKQVQSNGEQNMDSMLQYFYALIAMTCLYGCFVGLESSESIQANITDLGARRSVTPTYRLKLILADSIASILFQFASILLVLGYLILVLNVDFGTKIPAVILAGFVGCVIGVLNGMFVGCLLRKSQGIKMAILLGGTMICCFFSGLMISNMKSIVEHSFPIFNRINPAALLTDAFMSLNIYETYDRYILNLSILSVMAVLLCVGSFVVIRRETYDSL